IEFRKNELAVAVDSLAERAVFLPPQNDDNLVAFPKNVIVLDTAGLNQGHGAGNAQNIISELRHRPPGADGIESFQSRRRGNLTPRGDDGLVDLDGGPSQLEILRLS